MSEHMHMIDLEEKIMDCWNITKELQTLSTYIADCDLSNIENHDKILNILSGIEALYEIKFDNLFTTFEGAVKEYHENKNRQV